MIRKLCLIAATVLLSVAVSVCADKPSEVANAEQIIDKMTALEAANVKNIERYTPLVETYVQTYTTDKETGRAPHGDQWFLGRVSFKGRISNDIFVDQAEAKKATVSHKMFHRVASLSPVGRTWEPSGFAQMAIIDKDGFNRQHYDFTFVKREYLGTVRCLVFDVMPKSKSGIGRFRGRIYVEDHDYNIVRFNGLFVRPKEHTAYAHFDSWRVNVKGGQWLPAYIYGEESSIDLDGKKLAFKSQTRLWGYSASLRRSPESKSAEFTAVLVDDSITDQSGSNSGPLSPLGSERAFERQAENNVLEKLEDAGLLAPPNEVDKVLQTVTNNLIFTNELIIEPEVRCRVLLTSPIESLTVGHTIIISRGLLDVLPDEASLAAVLAHELSHIVLAHEIDTRLAFGDRMLFNESETILHLSMAHTAEEEAAADKQSLELLAKSPYKDKFQTIGLFLKQIHSSHDALPNLTRGRLGNSLVDRLGNIMANAPELKKTDVQQTAALPLGARIDLDPWNNHVELTKAQSVAALNAHEKLPLLITPFYPYLNRVGENSLKSETKPNLGENTEPSDDATPVEESKQIGRGGSE